MTHQDPKQVIIDYVRASSVISSDTPVPQTSGWRKQESRGGFSAKPETIRFLKERSLLHCQLHFVTFEDEQGHQTHLSCYVIEENDGTWNMYGGSGGAGRGPQRTSPWANLGGGGWPNQFYAGGYVQDNGQDVVRVRLLSHNGVLLEDSVDNGIVLFLSDQPIEQPLQATLYDRQGALVGTHTVFDISHRLP